MSTQTKQEDSVIILDEENLTDNIIIDESNEPEDFISFDPKTPEEAAELIEAQRRKKEAEEAAKKAKEEENDFSFDIDFSAENDITTKDVIISPDETDEKSEETFEVSEQEDSLFGDDSDDEEKEEGFSMIQILQNTIDKLNARLEELAKSKKLKQDEIADLEQRIKDLQEDVKEITAENKEIEKEENSVNTNVKKLETMISEAKK